MSNQDSYSFIIIDDDPINNLICRKNIQKVLPEAEIQTFTEPKVGLEYIQAEYTTTTTHNTILFLDINMPVLSGWDVLDILMDKPDEIKRQFTIYILSSSIATKDREQADESPIVKGFLTKPLTTEEVQAVLN